MPRIKHADTNRKGPLLLRTVERHKEPTTVAEGMGLVSKVLATKHEVMSTMPRTHTERQTQWGSFVIPSLERQRKAARWAGNMAYVARANSLQDPVFKSR